MDDWEAHESALAAVGAKVVVAGSVDGPERAGEVADGISFPIAHGVTREQGRTVGALWECDREFVQPAEFILLADGTVRASSYAAGPLGRLDAADAIRLISFWESNR